MEFHGLKIMLVTLLLVFLRAKQQLHVMDGRYVWAAITPYAIAAAEVASVVWVVQTGWEAIPWVGTGGAMGVTLAMYVHRRMRGQLR